MTKQELADLVKEDRYPSVSIQLPTSEVGRERGETPIRLTNLARRVERDLVDRGVRAACVRPLLQPVHDFIADRGWHHQAQGLALFASEAGMRTVETPYPLLERALVDRRFFIRPLLPLLENGRVYVLVLDQGHVRLLRGDRDVLDEVTVPDLPRTRDEVVTVRHPQKQTQGHSIGPAGRAHSMAMHGSRSAQDEEKEQLRQFCLAIDRAVLPVWEASRAPVVLAGVEYLTHLYRSVSALPLESKAIEGSPKASTLMDLRDEAWAIVRERYEAPGVVAAARFRELLGTGRAISHLEEVVPAAAEGRVDTLFLRDDAIAWGRYVPATAQVHRSAERYAGDEELLNLAAIDVLRRGGTVYERRADRMPSDAPVAALLRF
jgi:hypothetical protein